MNATAKAFEIVKRYGTSEALNGLVRHVACAAASKYAADESLAASWTGGRPDDDTKDCAIRALAIVSDLDYTAARALIESECQRPRRKGTPTAALCALLNRLAPRATVASGMKRWTLARFCAEHPRGVFYVLVRGHALAIIDGRAVDNGRISGARCRITGAWKFAD
jgi:hypothetical protein